MKILWFLLAGLWTLTAALSWQQGRTMPAVLLQLALAAAFLLRGIVQLWCERTDTGDERRQRYAWLWALTLALAGAAVIWVAVNCLL